MSQDIIAPAMQPPPPSGPPPPRQYGPTFIQRPLQRPLVPSGPKQLPFVPPPGARGPYAKRPGMRRPPKQPATPPPIRLCRSPNAPTMFTVPFAQVVNSPLAVEEKVMKEARVDVSAEKVSGGLGGEGEEYEAGGPKAARGSGGVVQGEGDEGEAGAHSPLAAEEAAAADSPLEALVATCLPSHSPQANQTFDWSASLAFHLAVARSASKIAADLEDCTAEDAADEEEASGEIEAADEEEAFGEIEAADAVDEEAFGEIGSRCRWSKVARVHGDAERAEDGFTQAWDQLHAACVQKDAVHAAWQQAQMDWYQAQLAYNQSAETVRMAFFEMHQLRAETDIAMHSAEALRPPSDREFARIMAVTAAARMA